MDIDHISSAYSIFLCFLGRNQIILYIIWETTGHIGTVRTAVIFDVYCHVNEHCVFCVGVNMLMLEVSIALKGGVGFFKLYYWTTANYSTVVITLLWSVYAMQFLRESV